MGLTRLIKQLHFWRVSGLLLADLILFGSTDPSDTPSFMLIVGFLMLSATLYYLLDGILSFMRLYGLPARHRKRLLKAAAILTSGVIALQSMGQLSTKDILILTPLTGLLYFYLAYSKSARRSLPARNVV